jgi:predicted dehydrogenase
MAHNVTEVREMTELARESGLATQLGTGAHSGYNYRSVAAMIKAGVIGDVQEVHCWCDQAWAPGDRPKHGPPKPPQLNWDLWIGPALVRPYHPTYHPHGWRSWWDFGNARLGDMGCHMIDLPFSALDLKHPLTIQAESDRPAHEESAPRWLIAKWTFPARGNLPPVELTWYDGDKRPRLQKEHNMPDWPEATLFVGSEGMLIADYGRFKLFPEDKFEGVTRPHIPQGSSHADDWLGACKDGGQPGCYFDYSGPLTETVLLGTVAYRAGQKLEWDGEKLEVTNCPEANELTKRAYREGWAL